MVEEERRVPGTGEEIVVQASDREMSSPVHALGQERRESRKIVGFQERGYIIPPCVVAPIRAHVPRQTSRVVVQPSAGTDPAWKRGVRVDGAEIDGQVRKGARCETASAILRWTCIVEPSRVGDCIREIIVRDFRAVTGDRGVRAVKQRRGDGVVSEGRPFPVGLIAGVVALGA